MTLDRLWTLALAASLMMAITAQAEPPPGETQYLWMQQTANYRVYLGIVPVELVKHQPQLLDEDKTLHDIRPDEKTGLSHVFAWIYRRPGNEPVRDAIVIAEVRHRDTVEARKPMEKMRLSTGVAYGNFFKVHRQDEHAVAVQIRDSNREGYETAVFTHVGR